MKKNMVLSVLLLIVCILTSGCFPSDADNAQGSPAPGGMPTPGPTAWTNDMGGLSTDGSGASGSNSSADASLDGGTSSGNVSGGSTSGVGSTGTASTGFDWSAQASAVEARIGMFSEVQDCRVVVSNGTALVGVKFNNAYQGDLTQRIRDMIAGEVMATDNTIQVVAVTADEQDVNEIYSLASQQREGIAPAELKQKIDRIARNATTLR